MAGEQTISVLIADDHPMLRSGIASVLTAHPQFLIAAEAEDGHAAVRLFQQFRPRITLMDLQMPGMDGLEAIKAVRQIDPHAHIIVLTTFEGDAQVTRCMQAGASGYILKSLVRTDLPDKIHAILAGRRVLPLATSGRLTASSQLDALSEREVVVLKLVAAGNSNRNVANLLGLQEGTIKAHMKTIFMKLDARDRTHAVMIALRRGFW